MLAQDAAPQTFGLWHLFAQSFDFFTVVLLAGSIAGVAFIVRCVMDIRPSRILPESSVQTLRGLIAAGRTGELREFTRTDTSFPSRVLAAAAPYLSDPRAAREAAELAASEQCANWFRRIEPLNIIGNLGPLVGLAGTVWGMIIAFSELSVSGGTAQASDLAGGISKALFHTLLGLCLATPCLLVFGFYRSTVDKVCTRAMVVASELLEALLSGQNGGEKK